MHAEQRRPLSTSTGWSLELAPVHRLVVGHRAIERWAEQERGSGRSLVITSPSVAKHDSVFDRLEAVLGRQMIVFAEAPPHTAIETVSHVEAIAREWHPECLIGVGGGSVIDLTKAVRHRLLDDQLAVSCAAIPSTLSGAEWTDIIGVTTAGVKQQWRDRRAAPDVVIHDRELAATTPSRTWLSTAIKALHSGIERVHSRDAVPLTTELCLAGITRTVDALAGDIDEPNTRLDMLLASAMIALAGSGVRSGIGAALRRSVGAASGAPHGDVSAVLLLPTLRFNVAHLNNAGPALALAFKVDPNNGTALLDRIQTLMRGVDLPSRLRELGVCRSALPELARNAFDDAQLAGNPRPIADPSELLQVLEDAW